MNAPAKFLVLLDAARPALLFDSDEHLLGEVTKDDGFIVDSLLLNAKVCADPLTDMFDAVVRPPSPDRTPKPVCDPQEPPDSVREPRSDWPLVAVTSARIEVRQRPRSFAFSRVCPRS